MQFGIIESILIIICFTLITTVICRSLRLPVIVGYLIVGSIVGPHALGWIQSTTQIKLFAEFGVALLMFTVGLEFSLSNLFNLKRSAFLVGAPQVILSIVATLIIGWTLKIGSIPSFIIGSIIAMSSTALVLKHLTDLQELNTEYGLHTTGILLFQDLAVIPILVFVSTLTQTAQSTLLFIIVSSLIKGTLVILAIFIIGRWILKPVFHLISKTQQIELFTLTVLFVAFSSAWFTHHLGLSYALGAFIAGVMLSECEYKQQIKAEIRPFRDILLGLFFISVGMLVNIHTWSTAWPWILLIVFALTVGKSILIVTLTLITKNNKRTAIHSGLLLAQGGEFGFAILSIALTNQLIPNLWGQSILAGILLCFIISALIIAWHKSITKWITL